MVDTTIIDAGCILHKTVLQHNIPTNGTMARELLVKICSRKGSDIHIVLDKYHFLSIKNPKRSLQKITKNPIFLITGPD